MDQERIKKLVNRAPNVLTQKIERAMEARLYGEVVVRMTFENGVPQIMHATETASYKT